MMRTRWLAVAAALVVLCLGNPATAAPVGAAAEAPLSLVPAQSPIVIQVRGLERTKKRLLAMIKSAVPDLAAKVEDKIEDGLKMALEGRALKGLAPDGPIFFVFMELPQGAFTEPPMMALIMRVTKYRDFVDGILTDDERKELKKEGGYEVATVHGESVYFVDRKDYAVVTPRKEAAEQFGKAQPGLDKKLKKEVAAKLLESDVSAYIAMEEINKAYGDKIKQFRQLIEFALQAAAGQGSGLDKNTLEMIKKFYDGIFQLIEDSRTFIAAADFQPEGLALHLQDQVGDDTKSNAFLKDAKPAQLTDLPKLQAGQMGYWTMHVDEALSKAFQGWMHGVMTSGDEDNKDIQEALNLLKKAAPQSWLGDFNLPMQGIQVWTYKDPAKAAEAQLKLFQAFKPGETFQSLILKDKPEVKANAESYKDFKLHAVSLEWDFEKFAEKTPGGKEMAEAMEKLMGKGLKSWFGTDGKVHVVVTGKDWDTARRHLSEFLEGKNTVGQNKSFQDALKHLPTQGTMLMVMDVPLYTQMIATFAQAAVKAQGLPFPIPDLKAPTGKSYAGMAITLQPERGAFDMWLPGTAVSEVRKMVEPALKDIGAQ